MAEDSPDFSTAKPLDAAAENRPVMEDLYRSPTVQHADNFSLSALFLLMVTVAAIMGFVSNAFQERSIDGVTSSYTPQSRRGEPLKVFSAIVLTLIGIFEGGRAGYLLRRRFSTLVVGSFYGMIAAAIPIAALMYPPSWLMVGFSCGILFAIGIALGAKSKRTTIIDEE